MCEAEHGTPSSVEFKNAWSFTFTTTLYLHGMMLRFRGNFTLMETYAVISLSPLSCRFPPGVGIMVAGKLEARGRGPNDIRLTLKEEIVQIPENDTGAMNPPESQVPVRLVGGRTSEEGRLQAST